MQNHQRREWKKGLHRRMKMMRTTNTAHSVKTKRNNNKNSRAASPCAVHRHRIAFYLFSILFRFFFRSKALNYPMENLSSAAKQRRNQDEDKKRKENSSISLAKCMREFQVRCETSSFLIHFASFRKTQFDQRLLFTSLVLCVL